jgi:hypothetical protein
MEESSQHGNWTRYMVTNLFPYAAVCMGACSLSLASLVAPSWSFSYSPHHPPAINFHKTQIGTKASHLAVGTEPNPWERGNPQKFNQRFSCEENKGGEEIFIPAHRAWLGSPPTASRPRFTPPSSSLHESVIAALPAVTARCGGRSPASSPSSSWRKESSSGTSNRRHGLRLLALAAALWPRFRPPPRFSALAESSYGLLVRWLSSKAPLLALHRGPSQFLTVGHCHPPP